MIGRQKFGIPTTYRGVNFRSQLEARYAILFDLLGLSWHYEPIELGTDEPGTGYIPDFLVDTEIWSKPQVRGPVLVEVRPHLHKDEYRESINKIAKSGWRGSAIVAGPVVDVRQTVYGEEHVIGYGHPSVIPEHAESSSCEWYPVGFCDREGEATGKFAYGGQADLRALMREASNRSQWQPPRRS